MSNEPNSALIGLLIDVSSSMHEAFEAEPLDDHSDDLSRLHAAFRAALHCAVAEEHHNPDAQIFIGIFGLKTKEDDDYGETKDEIGKGCPSMVDLCGVAGALQRARSERPSGHNCLIQRANRENVPHISRYIREKLTGDEARILDEYLDKNPSKVQQFVDSIPSVWVTATLGVVRPSVSPAGSSSIIQAGSLSVILANSPSPIPGFLGVASSILLQHVVKPAANAVADFADSSVENSKALRLARAVCAKWLRNFEDFEPRPVKDIVRILESLLGRSGTETRQDEAANHSPAVDTLKRYIYGRTPMHSALKQSLGIFRANSQFKHRVLLLLSDGRSTDGDPTPVAQELRQEKVTMATAYLTADRQVAQRQLYYEPAADWKAEQVTLFRMATKVSGVRYPIPVLASMGWEVPSQGQIGLFAIASTSEALNEFCSMTLSARFKTADMLLDIVGRVSQDKYIDYAHAQTCHNPADQGRSRTCYAHAAAGVIHMALVRIVGRKGGVPEIEKIRKRILAKFPAEEGVCDMADVLDAAVKWYRPLQFKEVNEDGARQAVLRRRKVLASFYLSQAGWDKFSQHYKLRPTSALTRRQMKPYRSQELGGGHAVIMTDCDPDALTFLNSWGKKWGKEGSFSVEDHTVLGLEGPKGKYPMRFYDVYWVESDLKDEELQAFAAKADDKVQSQAGRYPSLRSLPLRCPRCHNTAPLVNFRGSFRKATCPKCHDTFAPEPRDMF